MRLIDADALYKSFGASGNCNNCPLDAYKCQYYNEHTLMEFCERIDDAPTIDAVEIVDAEPVKHGHWVDKAFEPLRCSVCGITVDAINGIPWSNKGFMFCPHCGAKMDEVLNVPLRNGKSMMELERLMDEVEDV